MKMTYMERVERKTAFSRKMYCSFCGNHEYEIVEQLEPKSETPWLVRCTDCEHEGYQSPSREVAIARWKQEEAGCLIEKN